jgi:type III restriction enzyme
MKFHFEKNLRHQTDAVNSVLKVFEGLDVVRPEGFLGQYINTEIKKDPYRFAENIMKIQRLNGIDEKIKKDSNVIDVMMETGTGKTYTYTKTIFELNKHYGIFKFIIVVPTLAIKAGTVNFLKSESAIDHFKELYDGKMINLHVVESKKSRKNKKNYMPQAISNFVSATQQEKDKIQVLLINMGMINSETMKTAFDRTILDIYDVPFEAIAAVKPFMIIDEPHKFSKENKTWSNIQLIHPQYIIRYGATFKEYENLVYKLTAVNAFNNNLVKGVEGHITQFEEGKNAIVRFVSSDGKEAVFELTENGKKKKVKIGKKESLSKVHPNMSDVFIVKLNQSTVLLSNGMELKRGDKFNPYSFARKLQEIMIKKAIENHFKIEKDLLKREGKIKPLTLFFIDNIEEYRNEDGYLRKTVEQFIKTEAEKLLKTERDPFYRQYLEKTIANISQTHGGYFSQDNTGKDEAIEKEINEILHDKQAMLNLENPRRFIFSKWTLREGWDNPNVFQICKLRSSGSEISKLQEVGRGLRLPVNEYGNRVKDEQFYLHYFVDFTEDKFVDKLVNEINEKSGAISTDKKYEVLTDEMIKAILHDYDYTDENELLQELIVNKKVIDFSRKFLDGGFNYIKENYPLIFKGVGKDKVRKAGEQKKKVSVRVEKYPELKALWEKINEKVLLEYKFKDEREFERLFIDFLKDETKYLMHDGINFVDKRVEIENDQAMVREENSAYNLNADIKTMKYSEFLKDLSHLLFVNIKTLHLAFVESNVDVNKFLNHASIRRIVKGFNDYLMYKAFTKFSITYHKITNHIHPTKLTDKQGNPLKEVDSSGLGTQYSDDRVADSYYFEELFYDSDLEKENIKKNIQEVIVFTKIPKNSIRIPIAGGKTFSPDFAYVLKFNNGEKQLHFVVETKNVEGKEKLRPEELEKIKHAEKFFGETVKIKFRTQFKSNNIEKLIREVLAG